MFRTTIIATALLATPLSVAAEGVYIGAGGANLFVDGQDRQLAEAHAPLDLRQKTAVGAFGALGYQFADGFGAEVEGGLRRRAIDGAAQAATGRRGDEQTTQFMLNARLSPPTRGPLKPYAGVGAGVAIVNSADHSLRSETDDVAPAGQAMAGFSVDLSDRTSFFAEYRYFKLLEDTEPTAAGADRESHSGLFGLRVRLGSDD